MKVVCVLEMNFLMYNTPTLSSSLLLSPLIHGVNNCIELAINVFPVIVIVLYVTVDHHTYKKQSLQVIGFYLPNSKHTKHRSFSGYQWALDCAISYSYDCMPMQVIHN